MEANKDDIAVEKEPAVIDAIDLDVDKDTMEGQQIAVHDVVDSGESKTANPEDCQMRMSMSEVYKSLRSRTNKEQMRQSRELMGKLRCMLRETPEERHAEEELIQKMFDNFRLEMQRRTSQAFIASNRHCSQLKKVWMNRGLPVDRESLQYAAASKDAFDMSSLRESLPSKPHAGDDEFQSKSQALSKRFLELCEQTRELARIKRAVELASNPPELNNNLPSCSSEVRQPDTLVDTVQKMCRDVKNIRLLSLRCLRRTPIGPGSSSNSSMNGEVMSFSELLKSHANKKYEETQNLDGESKLQNDPTQSKEFEKCDQEITPEVFQFYRRWDEKCGKVGQELRDSILLDRQMSRLKIANSNRSDLSEGKDESEIKEASSDENKSEQDKAAIINQKRELKIKLLSILDGYKGRTYCRKKLELTRK